MSTTITKTVGRVSIVPKGAWSSAADYSRLDVVTNGGNSYIAKTDIQAGTALASTDWMLLTQKGSTGSTGTTFTPAVDSAGNLSWTNDGNKQNPATVNILSPYRTAELQDAIDSKLLSLKRGSALPSNVDLDTYTDQGNYYIASGSIAETITASGEALPYTTGSSLIKIFQGAAYATTVVQVQIGTSSPDAPCWFRIKPYSTADFKPWYRLANNALLQRSNLLYNGYFIGGGSQKIGTGYFPINQRGQTSYNTASKYCIDGWFLNGSPPTVTLSTDGLTIDKTSGSSPGFMSQIINIPYVELAGRQVTMSVLYDGGFATGTGTFPTTPPSDGKDIITLGDQIPNGSKYSRLRVMDSELSGQVRASIGQTAGSSLKFKAVKVELGDTQTLAHQEKDDQGNTKWVLNELPDYNEELEKCQRYFWRLNGSTDYLYPIGFGFAYTTTKARINIIATMSSLLNCEDFSACFFAFAYTIDFLYR